MDHFFRLANRERRLQFGYLLLAIGALSGLTSWVVFRNTVYSRAESSYLYGQIRHEEEVLQNQLENLALLDSTYQSIISYQPQVNAVFLEVSIEDYLTDIRRLSMPSVEGTQFRAFRQIADFYRMMYVDKKVAWSKQTNLDLFRKQLEACSVGLLPSATAPTTSAVGPLPPAAVTTSDRTRP